MSGKPAARLGDPTACPLPGHGNNPIAEGSPDVFFDGFPAARQGDATVCGGTLSTHVIPNVLINGLPACVVGTLGSHGNVIVGGSGTVLIGNTSGSPAPAIQAARAPKLCLQCLLLAAQRNQTFVPLESLGARR
ncbi:PAAR domain-containing protein [Pseudomonas fulva]|uniref:PAAR domain-containing protein n=1 Tax=Pseudomonas fulva TaxID=47880 RepID=UPI00201DEC75|nr:PAAR domain-containing protein [Pseudomonas fulva]UQY36808.1 PAAR domain-containing protein [Pseudomonas fulva]